MFGLMGRARYLQGDRLQVLLRTLQMADGDCPSSVLSLVIESPGSDNRGRSGSAPLIPFFAANSISHPTPVFSGSA